MLKGMRFLIAFVCIFICSRAFSQTTVLNFLQFESAIASENFYIQLISSSYEWGSRVAIDKSGRILGWMLLTPSVLRPISTDRGAFEISNQNTVSFSGSLEFEDFNGAEGSVFLMEKSRLNFNGNFVFRNNAAQEQGGTFYIEGSNINFNNSTIYFLDNFTMIDDNVDDQENGGAIFLAESTMSFTNTSIAFSDNKAMNGGAIHSINSSISFVGAAVDFSNNIAQAPDDTANYKSGGAIFAENTNINFIDSEINFIGNEALAAGAIFANNSNINFTNAKVNFYGNVGGKGVSAISFINDEISQYSLEFIHSSVSFINNVSDTDKSVIAVNGNGTKVSFIDSNVFFVDNKGSAIDLRSGMLEFNAKDKDMEVLFKGNKGTNISDRRARAPRDDGGGDISEILPNDISLSRASHFVFDVSLGRKISLTNGIRAIGMSVETPIIKTGKGSLIFDGDMTFSIYPLDIREGSVILKNPYNEIVGVKVSSFSVLSLAENGYGILAMLTLDLEENSILILDADFSPSSINSDKIVSSATVNIDNAALIINEINMTSWRRGKSAALLYSKNPFTYNFQYDDSLYALYYRSNTSYYIPNTNHGNTGRYSLWAKYIGPEYLIEEASFLSGIIRTMVIRDPRDKVYPKIKSADLPRGERDILQTILKSYWGQISVDGINMDIEHAHYFNSAAYDLSAGSLFIDNERHKVGFFLSGGYERFSQINNDALANNMEIGLYGGFFLKEFWFIPNANEIRYFLSLGYSEIRAHVGGEYENFPLSQIFKIGIEDSYVLSDRIKPYAGFRYSSLYNKEIQVEELRIKIDRKTYERLIGYGGVRHERTFNRWFWYAKGELGFLIVDNTVVDVYFGHLWNERLKADVDPFTLGLGSGFEFSLTPNARLFADANIERTISADFTHYNAQVGIRIGLPIIKEYDELESYIEEQKRIEQERLEKERREKEKEKKPAPVAEPKASPESEIRIVQQVVVVDEYEALKAIENMPPTREGYVSVIALVRRDKGEIWITMLEFKAEEFIKNDYQFDSQTQRQLDEKIDEFISQGIVVGDMRAVYNGPEISEQDIGALIVKTGEIYKKLKDKERETFKDAVNEEKIDEAIERRGQALMSYRIQAASFLFNSAQLSPQAKENIKEMAQEIQSGEYKKIIVEGHTCPLGDIGFNLILSMRRARAVQEELSANGIAADKIECIGFGPALPIEDNKTRQGRSVNRRVEIFVE